jgi:transposase
MAYGQAILDRLISLQGTNFEVRDVKITPELIEWRIEHKEAAEYICPRCDARHTACYSRDWIKIWDIPWGSQRCLWRVRRAKILCHCGLNPVVERMDFRSKHHRLTQRFVEHVEQILCSKMFTVADVSRLFYLDYGIVYKIDHDVLLRLWQTVELPQPENIAVDEKSFRKTRQYVTIVTDLDRKLVIWVSPGNSKESLDQFFQILGPEKCSKIKTVSKDLHAPYIASCQQYVPQALEVADPFHVVQRLNQAMDECRLNLSLGSALQTGKRKIILNLQWLLRRKNEHLGKAGRLGIDELARVNEPLYHAYLLKESFYELYNYGANEISEARDFIKGWCDDAMRSPLEGLQSFASYLLKHEERIINSLKTGLSSAISEGINNKISVIKRMAYGYRNLQYFMLKILQRCGILGYPSKTATS